MCSCIRKQQSQFGVVLFPNKQPIGTNMAFPRTYIITCKFVRSVFLGKCTRFGEQVEPFHGIILHYILV